VPGGGDGRGAEEGSALALVIPKAPRGGPSRGALGNKGDPLPRVPPGRRGGGRQPAHTLVPSNRARSVLVYRLSCIYTDGVDARVLGVLLDRHSNVDCLALLDRRIYPQHDNCLHPVRGCTGR
jgi:hypothetical protein